MRWWDGNEWTEHRQSAAPTQTGYAPQPKKSHTLRNVILIVCVLIVLSFVGCVALIGGAANEVGKSIGFSQAKDSEPGGPDNPLKITEGKTFDVSGFSYAAGWKLSDDELGSVDIKGLKVTNNRDKKDSAFVEIKFMNGNEVLALSNCATEPIAVGQKTTLSCLSGDDLPKKYDAITINDSF